MFRPVGPLCTEDVGTGWVDPSTSTLSRTPAPAERHAELPHAAPTHGRRHHRHHQPARRNGWTGTETQLLAALRAAGVVDPTEQAMFLAQVAHESAGFTRLREGIGRYSAENLVRLFPTHFRNLEDARAVVARGADAVAERAYGHRMGNDDDGDGARYIGRGYIQLTGRNNYEAAGDALGLDLLNHPELAEDPLVAARIAVWFWMGRQRLRRAGQNGNVETATQIINGGQNGLDDRRRRFNEYQHELNTPTIAPPP